MQTIEVSFLSWLPRDRRLNVFRQVPTSNPLLRALPALVDTLNDTRDLALFIMQVRQAFVELTA